jgi:hypothetical protein
VAYKLALPEESRVHPVFHISQLKPCIGSGQQVLSTLPNPDDTYQIPVLVLQHRVCQQGLATVAQVLVQWSDASPGEATWEDLDTLKQ